MHKWCGKPVVREGYCQKCIDETVCALKKRIKVYENSIAEAEKNIQKLEGETSPWS